MPSVKEYNIKLTSLKNTQKITKTMKMVSASKLRRAQEAQRNANLYAMRLNDLIGRLSATISTTAHPLLTRRSQLKKTMVVLFTSDRGLCGGFNNNMCKFLYNWMITNSEKKVEISFCGKRGFNYFRKRAICKKHYDNVTQKPNFSSASQIGKELINGFIAGEYDEIYLAYNFFKNPLSQKPSLQKLLPIEPGEIAQGSKLPAEYIFEPEQEKLLAMLLPRSVYFKIYYTLLENAAGEHGARMTSMDNATTNAKNLIKSYTLVRNRVRQASITRELSEIVAGAEAL